MRLVVMDLEMNQTETRSGPNGKIIQIGAVLVDTKGGVILDEFTTMVNPYEELNPKIVELTGIHQSFVDMAKGIDEAGKEFWDWAKASECGMRIGSWGGDVYWLKEQCPCPYRVNFHNIKAQAEWIRDVLPGKQTGGLQSTLNVLGLTFEGRPHDALDDAINTAYIAFEMTKALDRYYFVKRHLW